MRKLVAEGCAFASLPANMDDARNPLLSDAKDLSQGRYRLTFLVTGANFGISGAFGVRAIGDGELRQF